jgi:hypothetical protein
MLDTTAHAEPRLPRPASAGGMDEPGIFKGCRAVDGPLPEATKRAILAYLGKPNAAGWERLKPSAIVGGTTLGEAWAIANPSAARRFPTSAELIRSLRVAVIAQWAGSAAGPLNTH